MVFWFKLSVCRKRRFFKFFIFIFLILFCCIIRFVKFENYLFFKKLYIVFKVYNEFFDKFKILRVEYFSFLVYLFNMVLYNLLLERFNIFSDFNGFRVKVEILKILYLFRVKFFKVRFFIG